MSSFTMTSGYQNPRLLIDYILDATTSSTSQPCSVDVKTLRAYGQEDFLKYVESIENELSETFVDDWDGYGAKPTNRQAIRNCAAFLLLLQDVELGIFSPTIEPEPNGNVTLEWYVDPSNLLHVTFDSSKAAYYACLFEGKGHYGDLDIDEEIIGIHHSIFAQIVEAATATTN